jgi:hypothetical protein
MRRPSGNTKEYGLDMNTFPAVCHTVSLWIVALLFFTCSQPGEVDESLSISIGSDENYSMADGRKRPRIVLENSRFRAVVATKKGGRCGIESGILEYINKATGTDQVASIVDANYMRGPITSAEITDDGPRFKRVVMTFEDLPDEEQKDNSGSVAYTIFANSPVLKIEYLDRLPPPDPIVDLGAPGGVRRGTGRGFSEGASTRVWGQEEFKELVSHPATYWTSVSDDPRLAGALGPVDGGPLNYNGHIIVAVASDATGEGYGRVVPIHRDGESGGARHLKLLWNTGIEFYAKPWTDNEYGSSAEEQTYAPPFVAYLFFFDKGLDAAMKIGKAIADGDMEQ